MTTLAVFAHFDPGGDVAPHVNRYLADLAGAVDRVVVVSAAPGLHPEAAARLSQHGELVTRENFGYDFASWKAGLEQAGDWSSYDRVVLANDSVVGPFTPLREVLGARAPTGVDFWGMTASRELEPHVQSWFVVYERGALATGLPQGFWKALVPISDRYHVIRRYEIGLSRLLRTAGLRMGCYLRPGPADLLRAHRRYRHAMSARPDRRRAARQVASGRTGVQHAWRELTEPMWNPSYVFWDMALDGRLPFVKVEVLRDDPYRMGNEHILRALEQAHPRDMSGVREYLERTRSAMKALRGI